MSSKNSDKYEYLTGEDLDYNPITVKQTKFEHSSLSKLFNKGLKEEEKKEGLLKRVKNIEDKSEEQLEVFSKANKVSRSAKNENEYNYDNKFAFYRFCRDFGKFKKRSLGSECNDTSEFYKILSEFKIHKIIPTKTRERRKRVMNNVVKLYGCYFDSYEETYDKENLNEKERRDPKQFRITSMEDNALPKWLESKRDFNEAKNLINDIRIDTNNVEVSYKDKIVFNDVNRLITDISNSKVKQEDFIKRLKKIISDLNQL